MTRSIATRRPSTPRRRRALLPQAEGLEERHLLSAGQLDLTFGTSGYTQVEAASPSRGWVVQVRSDRKILAAGFTLSGGIPSDFRLVRLNPDGSRDTGFGSGGSVTTDFAGDRDELFDMATSDNRIVLVGTVRTISGKGKQAVMKDNIGLACYNSDGTLDTSFGTAGKVMTHIGTYGTTRARGVVIQEDGKIVVGGSTQTSTGSDAVLVRYNTNGSLDDGLANDTTPGDSFGTGGFVQMHMANYPYSGVTDLALLSDPTDHTKDKIVTTNDLSTNAQDSVMVARYFTVDTTMNGVLYKAGSLDPSWGTNGQSTIAPSLLPWGMALQPDGSVVVTGDDPGVTNGGFLLRYTNSLGTAGQLDPNFGTNGINKFSDTTAAQHFTVAVQPDGKIIDAGAGYVARFGSIGLIDRTFGNNGFAHDTFPNGGIIAHATLQLDGKIVAVGTGIIRVDSRTTKDVFLIARYQGDTAAPSSASMALTGGATSIGPSAATGQPKVLIPLTDHDLSQLATEVILIRPKRRGALSSGFALLRGGL